MRSVKIIVTNSHFTLLGGLKREFQIHNMLWFCDYGLEFFCHLHQTYEFSTRDCKCNEFLNMKKGVIAQCCNNHITWCCINDIAWRTETRSYDMNIARSSHTLPLLLMKLLLLSLLTMLFDVMLFSRFMLFFMIFRGISKVFPGYFQYISKVLCDGWMDRIDAWTPSRLLHTYDYNITFGQT